MMGGVSCEAKTNQHSGNSMIVRRCLRSHRGLDERTNEPKRILHNGFWRHLLMGRGTQVIDREKHGGGTRMLQALNAATFFEENA